MHNPKVQTPWIYNAFIDLIFIISPPFLSLAIIYCFPGQFSQEAEVNLYQWLFLVVFIDVAHVYSTLFRTYFDKETFQLHSKTLLYIPIFSWISGIILYSISSNFFWTCLAYLAVYHFIRQQYGFARIYTRKEIRPTIFRIADNCIIYVATIYPIIYWHLHPRNFSWFIPGDFLSFETTTLIDLIFQSVYVLIIITYLILELYTAIIHKVFNLSKNLIIGGTLLSWYFGIIYFNGDMTFTFLNVISHGIPYIALIWIYGKRKFTGTGSHKISFLFSGAGIILFLVLLTGLAFFEEGIWDAILWKERPELFNAFYIFPAIPDTFLKFIIPLLALPQITHYIIDGYIWKLKKDKFRWKRNTLNY